MVIRNTKVVCLFLFILNSALISGQLRTYPIPPAYFHSTNSLPILRYLHTALSINVMYQFPVQVQRLKPMFDARTVYLFGELRCDCLMTTLYCVYCVCVTTVKVPILITCFDLCIYVFFPEQCYDIHLTIINIIFILQSKILIVSLDNIYH